MKEEERRKLEEQLQEMVPADPPVELTEKVSGAMRRERFRARSLRWRRGLVWIGTGMAACLLIGLGLGLWSGRIELGSTDGEEMNRVAMEGKSPVSTQVHAQNQLRQRIDEGVVFLDNGLAARRYRFEFVDRMVVEDPEDGSRMEVMIPREEVVLVPVHSF